MVGIDGKVIAEPNDPNSVLADTEIFSGVLTNNKIVMNYNGKAATLNAIKSLITTGSSGGWYAGPSLSANKYLCTDANGNLIFKEL